MPYSALLCPILFTLSLLSCFCAQAQSPARPGPAAAQTTPPPVPTTGMRPDWIGSVVLASARPLNPATLGDALRKRLSPADRFEGIDQDKGVLAIKVAGGRAFVSLINTPIPDGELQRVCHFAWHWPAACDAIKDHRAHYLVVLIGTTLDRLDSALLQTRVLAALLDQGPALAAYWGTTLQSRADFLAGSDNLSRQNIPTTLWITFRMAREKSGAYSLATQGLKDFGIMEMEARETPLPGPELFDLVLGAVTHLLARGPFIRDGDTIGPTADKRVIVRHAESWWNPGEKVHRLQFTR